MSISAKFLRPGGDPLYVNVTGDTMTGPLVLAGDPTSALHAATMQYVINLVAQVNSGSIMPSGLDGGAPDTTVFGLIVDGGNVSGY